MLLPIGDNLHRFCSLRAHWPKFLLFFWPIDARSTRLRVNLVFCLPHFSSDRYELANIARKFGRCFLRSLLTPVLFTDCVLPFNPADVIARKTRSNGTLPSMVRAALNEFRCCSNGSCKRVITTNHDVFNAFVFFVSSLNVRRDARGVLFVALRSATQRHRFNQPYQLGTGSKDRAEDAQPFLFYVRCDTLFLQV